MVAKKKTTTKQASKIPFNLVLRIALAAALFIIGFNFSYSSFFKEFPLFGINFLAESLISIVSAAIGFYLIPMLVLQIRDWVETLIINTVSDIVGSFWDQQTKRMNDRKREKQKKESEEKKREEEQALKNAIVLDTSVLVDGRILDIMQTGFISSTLIIAECVMDELQLIADSEKKQKRERGRRGLDVVKKLKSKHKVLDIKVKSKSKGVDKRVMEYAKENKVRLMTLDFNLNKLAQAAGVQVLNINDLVEAVKVSVIPGETVEVEIVQEGKSKRQGVGYMPDGTMIVVEEARELVGEKVEAKVKRVIQSSAGKIIFCELPKEEK